MKGFFSWAAVALLIVSTSINYSMVSDQSNRAASSSTVVRSPGGSSGGWHK